MTTLAARCRTALAAACLVLLTRPAAAAGYAINDQGSRGMASGLATVSTLAGPECVFYNPAGIVGSRDWQLSLGSTLLLADFSATPEETVDLEFESAADTFVVPHLYLVKGFSERLALGVGVNAPFGLGTEWPRDFPGRFVSRIADLETVQLSAVVSARVGRRWSVGGGPTWTVADVRLVRDVDLSIFRAGHQAEADLTGEAAALGYRFGVRWRGDEGWSFGFALQGETELGFDGEVDYTVPELGAFSLDQAIMTLFRDGPADTTLTLPATASTGVGRVGRLWTWEGSLTWTHWSVQDKVVIDLEPIEAGGLALVVEEFTVNDWTDVVALRAGVRRTLGERWSLAAGAYFDESPVPVRTADPLLPDSDRLSLTAGATYARGRFAIDFATQVVHFADLDTRGTSNEFPSRYDASVLSFGVTAGWRWGR